MQNYIVHFKRMYDFDILTLTHLIHEINLVHNKLMQIHRIHSANLLYTPLFSRTVIFTILD